MAVAEALTRPALPQREFIALIAMMFATVAYGIDAMLPAIPEIGAALSPDDPNKGQLVLTAFVLGMGIGTFAAGPLADARGRKAVILGGFALYALGGAMAVAAPSLEWLLLARLLQGLGAAGPRVASMAMVRDLYAGPRMSQVVSFAMMVFMIVPAAAPALGQVIIGALGWRAVFASFVVFAVAGALWMGLRQPETLLPAARRPLAVAPMVAGLRDVLGRRTVLASVLAQTCVFGALFGTLSSVQAVFAQVYGKGDSFPAWFALIALFSAGASLLNASVVRRAGMWRLAAGTLAAMAAATGGMLLAVQFVELPFAVFFLWLVGVFGSTGLTIGNLNAMALERLGHVAGLASSILLAVPTVLSTLIAAPMGLMFDGTPVPLVVGVLVCLCTALSMMPLLRPLAGQTPP
jgi:DHA1 family bicyclomycin/chloramphenicol resistance-like MFS transporter